MTLTPLTSERRKLRLATYDLEWLPREMKLRLIGVKDREKGYRYYENVDTFLTSELTTKNNGKVYFAHAGGLADILFIFGRLLERGYQCYGVSSGSSIIILRVERGSSSWTFVDSFWLFRDSLASIAESLGMKKGSCEWDAPLPELIDYNHLDNEILLRALERFEDELWELGGELKMTIASSGMTLFRRVYLTESLEVPRVVNETLRSGNCGGRVEVHKRFATGTVYDWDINSSYPYTMTGTLPGNYRRASRKLGPLSWVRARVKTTGDIPALPYRKDALYFPNGEWDGWFYCEELDQTGIEITKIFQTYEFEPNDMLCAYVEDIYARRKATLDPFQKLVYKYLMNCLYGKFGERPDKIKLIINPSQAWLKKHREGWKRARNAGLEYEGCEILIPGVFLEKYLATVAHEHVGLAGAITASARKHLRSYMLEADPLYYCDTDGFVSSRADLEDSIELGALKLKRKAETGEFLRPKVYRLDNDIKAKGFPLKAIAEKMCEDGFEISDSLDHPLSSPELRMDLFGQIKAGEEMHYHKMMRVGQQLKGRKIPRPIEVLMSKRLRNVRPKRCPLPFGDTRPWEVEELEAL